MSADLVNASSSSTNSVSKHAAQQRILAVVFPELMSELVLQRLQLTKRVPLTWAVVPHAVVLTDSVSPEFSSEVSSEVSSERQSQPESKAELDAVNLAAHRLGIRPHQTIGQASAIVENLRVYPLPRAHVLSALQHIAEMAVGFGKIRLQGERGIETGEGFLRLIEA